MLAGRWCAASIFGGDVGIAVRVARLTNAIVPSASRGVSGFVYCLGSIVVRGSVIVSGVVVPSLGTTTLS